MSVQTHKKSDANDLRKAIEEKAYQIYLKRLDNGISGDDQDDWIHAEKQVAAGRMSQTKSLMKRR
jgi:hypothetical protein